MTMLSQSLEVEGETVVKTMQTDTLEESVVLVKPDGTLVQNEIRNLKGPQIGEFHEGGIVFYLFNGGESGLIMSLEDLSENIVWSPDLTDLDNVESVYSGQLNTDSLILNYGNTSNYAALECDNYFYDGFADWYLPSRGELKILMSNMLSLNYALENDSNPNTQIIDENSEYWSSTQRNTTLAYTMSWNWSTNILRKKDSQSYKIRAIRKF